MSCRIGFDFERNNLKLKRKIRELNWPDFADFSVNEQ